MGRGNICVNENESIFFIDNDKFHSMVCTEAYNGYEVGDDALAMDIDYADIDHWEIDEIQTEDNWDELKSQIVERFGARYKSFWPSDGWVSRDRQIIMESKLFYLAVADNEWSQAVMLLAKEDDYQNLFGLQQGVIKHYENTLKHVLLELVDSIGIYTGAWTSGFFTRDDLKREDEEKAKQKSYRG